VTAAALVCAGLLSVLIFPSTSLTLLRRGAPEPAAPEPAAPEPAAPEPAAAEAAPEPEPQLM
jgi:hypothetical protein